MASAAAESRPFIVSWYKLGEKRFKKISLKSARLFLGASFIFNEFSLVVRQGRSKLRKHTPATAGKLRRLFDV
jgi:hypothetical protein